MRKFGLIVDSWKVHWWRSFEIFLVYGVPVFFPPDRGGWGGGRVSCLTSLLFSESEWLFGDTPKE